MTTAEQRVSTVGDPCLKQEIEVSDTQPSSGNGNYLVMIYGIE
jgi:hypothetical protein